MIKSGLPARLSTPRTSTRSARRGALNYVQSRSRIRNAAAESWKLCSRASDLHRHASVVRLNQRAWRCDDLHGDRCVRTDRWVRVAWLVEIMLQTSRLQQRWRIPWHIILIYHRHSYILINIILIYRRHSYILIMFLGCGDVCLGYARRRSIRMNSVIFGKSLGGPAPLCAPVSIGNFSHHTCINTLSRYLRKAV